jgi:hypothetical protein
MTLDRKFLLCAFAYAVLGMSLGVYMGASKIHVQFVTHAHILLVGFVVSFIYALVHKLWLSGVSPALGATQFYLHQSATLVMVCGLFLLFAGAAPEATVGPILGISSIGVLAAALLMLWMILKSRA